MAAHLAFLLASLFLAHAWPELAGSIGLGAVALTLNAAWSITMTPGIRALARDLLMRFNARKTT